MTGFRQINERRGNEMQIDYLAWNGWGAPSDRLRPARPQDRLARFCSNPGSKAPRFVYWVSDGRSWNRLAGHEWREVKTRILEAGKRPLNDGEWRKTIVAWLRGGLADARKSSNALSGYFARG